MTDSGGYVNFDDDDDMIREATRIEAVFTQEAGEAFEPSPRPTKRRRIEPSSTDGDDAFDPPVHPFGRSQEQHASNTTPQPSDEDSDEIFEVPIRKSVDTKKTAKSKHRVHIPNQPLASPETWQASSTLVPGDSSSLYRSKGARLQKKPRETAVTEEPELGNTEEAEAKSLPELQPLISGGKTFIDVEQELADLPSDAFASSNPSPTKPDNEVFFVSSQPRASPQKRTTLVGPQAGLRQTTLFGGTVQQLGPASQANKRHNWPLANKEEPPTHHKLDQEAIKTWVYPTNLGTIRDYQYNIVSRGLYHNLLVALPTGLGKTFIAATIMLNWFRWTKDAQIVFVAPTKPLVAQQVGACFGIAGIPRSETTVLTGGIAPGLRAEEWASKRVFFMTPQTIINDLKTGICDPKKIVLLVVDEAHRATGAYAYVEVVKFIRRFNTSFRVLALTATPGASVESVQEVIDGLDVSRVEIRTEFSLDIRQYVHTRKTETMIFDNSEEMEMVMDLFSKALQPVVNKLNGQNAYWSKDPMALTPYGLTQARQKWMLSDAGKRAPMGLKAMVNGIFTVLASLAHSIELLKYHGIGPFYHCLVSFRRQIDDGGVGAKYRKEINGDENFVKLMNRVHSWINNPDFIGHPKLDYLQAVVLNHFLDAGDGRGNAQGAPPSGTRIMVFAHYRDSAEEIVRILKRNEPMVRPHVFVGQAASRGSEGMDQKRQLEIIQKFKTGTYNTLVATSIGEEGLDIGEVDLIVCYDSSASPIRMLQRMGRTGRKRAGNIVLLLMRGKEENSFKTAKDNYEKMQGMIAAGTRFQFHDDRSPRILPHDVHPVVDKRTVEIPLENSQPDLPEPKKRGRVPKRPPKKFHMPDGVRTGFVKASRLQGDDEGDASSDGDQPRRRAKRHGNCSSASRLKPVPESVTVPPLSDVLLSHAEEKELERKYQYVYDGNEAQTVAVPRITAYPERQRTLGRTQFVKHGRASTAAVRLFNKMHNMNEDVVDDYQKHLRMEDVEPYRQDDLGLVSEAEAGEVLSDGSLPSLPAKTANRKSKKPTDPPRGQKRAIPLKGGPAKRRRTKDRSDIQLDAMDAGESSPPATDPRLRIQSHGISLESSSQVANEEEEGADSELDDFIVDHDVEDQVQDSSVTSSSPAVNPSTKPFFVSQKSVQSRSDDDLPEISTLAAGTGITKPKLAVHNNIARKRRRNVVDDDSDD